MQLSLLHQTDGVPAQFPESEGEGTGIALVPGIVTETGEEVAHGLLTEGVQGKQRVEIISRIIYTQIMTHLSLAKLEC